MAALVTLGQEGKRRSVDAGGPPGRRSTRCVVAAQAPLGRRCCSARVPLGWRAALGRRWGNARVRPERRSGVAGNRRSRAAARAPPLGPRRSGAACSGAARAPLGRRSDAARMAVGRCSGVAPAPLARSVSALLGAEAPDTWTPPVKLTPLKCMRALANEGRQPSCLRPAARDSSNNRATARNATPSAKQQQPLRLMSRARHILPTALDAGITSPNASAAFPH